MEIIFLRKIAFICIIFSFTLIVKCEENTYCSAFTDCNKCVLCNDESKTPCKCDWTNNGCAYYETTNFHENENWYSKVKTF